MSQRWVDLMRDMGATFVSRRGGVVLLDDRGDVIVEWPKGCPDSPRDLEAAMQAAAVIIAERWAQ